MARKDRGFGVDIGGTGIKGAPVDLKTGNLVGDRFRIPTPRPSVPKAVAEVTHEVVDHFTWKESVGITFPAVVTKGTVRTAANVDKAWIGADGEKILAQAVGAPVVLMNDADAAGIAEMQFGAGRGRAGTVLVLTLGTGIGSALFVDGVLVPNTEVGHIEVKGEDAERKAAFSAKERTKISWEGYGKHVSRYLQTIHALLWPELIIIGGGASKKWVHLSPCLKVDCELVPAQLLNNAGIVGAALYAAGRAEVTGDQLSAKPS